MSNIRIGDVVRVADIEWIVLDKNNDAVLCLMKNQTDIARFDNNSNNYAVSRVRTWLNKDFLPTIIREVGEDALFDVKIDLTAIDGSKDYGHVVDKIGLLTIDMYQKYSDIITKFPMNSWCCTATPHSTPSRGETSYV